MRFFVVQGESPVLLGIPEKELLGILKIMCEVTGDPHNRRMLNSQTMQAPNGPSCKANKGQQIKKDNVDLNDLNSNMLDYFRSSINRPGDKRATQALINKIHNEFSDFFQELDVLKAHLI